MTSIPIMPLKSILNRLPSLRWWLARLPLPMLALAAAFGVYRFALIFVPPWVAITQALAFEATYIGLAAQDDLSDDGRRRAMYISIGAVVVSILYNTMAGIFDRNPDWLQDAPVMVEWLLAAMHGAPLAVVAYCVADLLLHSNGSSLSQVIADLRADVAAALARATDAETQLAAAQQVANSASQVATDRAQAATAAAQQLAAIEEQLAAAQQQRDELQRQLAEAQQQLAEPITADGLDVLWLAARAKQAGATWPELARATGIKEGTLRSRLTAAAKEGRI